LHASTEPVFEYDDWRRTFSGDELNLARIDQFRAGAWQTGTGHKYAARQNGGQLDISTRLKEQHGSVQGLRGIETLISIDLLNAVWNPTF